VEQDITWYEVLGVLPGAAADEIKREYDARIVARKSREKVEELMWLMQNSL
jgi:DnaJ-domain-containing protein 1